MCRTECTMFSEVYMGNPGKVPYCNERDQFEPDCTNCKRPNVTKADKIRSMTDEELDKFLGDVQWDVANYCGGVTQKQEYPVPEQRGAWLDWLKQEAEEAEEAEE